MMKVENHHQNISQNFGKLFDPEPNDSASINEEKLLDVEIREDGLGNLAIKELTSDSKKSVFIVRENVDDPASGGSESAQQRGVMTTACLPLRFIIWGLVAFPVGS